MPKPKKKKQAGKRKNQRSPDPTPEEIAEATAELRSTWDERTRLDRAGVRDVSAYTQANTKLVKSPDFK